MDGERHEDTRVQFAHIKEVKTNDMKHTSKQGA